MIDQNNENSYLSTCFSPVTLSFEQFEERFSSWVGEMGFKVSVSKTWPIFSISLDLLTCALLLDCLRQVMKSRSQASNYCCSDVVECASCVFEGVFFFLLCSLFQVTKIMISNLHWSQIENYIPKIFFNQT